MSVCSATDGSSLRLRKHSSVRNSPTPSTGACAAERDDSPSATLARSLTGPAVRGGARSRPGRAARPAARGRRRPGPRPPRRPARPRPCRRCRRPAPACPPPGTSRAGGADHAGDGELAGDDRRVAGRPAALGDQRETSAGSRPAVSAGARSSATSTEGSAGVGTPGSGSPTRWATRRSSMSRRSVTRSAIRPPMPVKTPANCSTAACTEVERGRRPRRRCLRDGAAQPLVPGQAGARGEHLGRGAGRAVGLALEAVGDGGRPRRRTPPARPRRRRTRRRRRRRPRRRRPRCGRAAPARGRRPGTTGVPRRGSGLGAVGRCWIGACGHAHS